MDSKEYYSYSKPLGSGKYTFNYVFNGRKGLMYICLFLFIPLVVMLLYIFGSVFFMTKDPVSSVDLNASMHELLGNNFWLSYILGQVILLIVYLYVIKHHKLPMFKREKWTLDKVIFLAWFTPLVTIGSSGLLTLVNSLKGTVETTANQVAVEEMVGSVPLWISFLLIVVLAPILEEIAFRGFILFTTKGSIVTYTRVFISGIIFSLLHTPTDIISFLVYFIMGFGMAYAVKRTNMLESSIIIHLFNNTVAFISLAITM